jgi:putative PIN family toxin of toxin-antitoxin system
MQTFRRLFVKFARTTPRIVLDTNVLISGTIVRHGFPARILASAVDDRIRLVVSPYLLAEYIAVIQRPHIARKYAKLGERLDLIQRFIQANAISVSPSPIESVIRDDPKDDAILACAFAGKAQYIVSGDEHLLRLGQYRGIKIISPLDFVAKILHEKLNERTT